MPHFNSFDALKTWILGNWIPANPQALQLDGNTLNASNPNVIVTFDLAEIPNLQARVALHGDTHVDVLKNLANASIEDFIVVPPQKGNKFWRFHFKRTHNYSNDDSADGLFAYLK